MSRSTTSREDFSFKEQLFDRIESDASWVVDWVRDNFAPGDVFDYSDLETWAKEHGFVEEESQGAEMIIEMAIEDKTDTVSGGE